MEILISNKMNNELKASLKESFEYCGQKDKSIDFTIQYMQDFSNTDLDTVIEFLTTELEFKPIELK